MTTTHTAPATTTAHATATPEVFTAGPAPVGVPNYTVNAYEVRTGGTGRTVSRVMDPDEAEIIASAWWDARFNVYVVLVEAVDGEWVGLHD